MLKTSKIPANIVLAAARLKACEMRPYFTAAFLSLTMIETPASAFPGGVGTVGVDKWYRCYYDPLTVERWGVEHMCAVFQHEIGHLLRNHSERCRSMDAHPFAFNLACFPAGTMLPCGTPIEEVATMSREFDGDLVTVASQAGEVSATPEHPFFVSKRKYSLGVQPRRYLEPEWVKAEEIRLGDLVLVPKINEMERRSDSVIDLSSYAKSGIDKLGRNTIGNRAVKEVVLDEDVAWLIGLWVAEGSASPTVHFSLGSHETEYADRIARIADEIGSSASRSTTGSSMGVTLGLVVFGRWLKDQCGSGAKNKHIPAVILRHTDPAIRQAFLRGLADGDGCDQKRGDSTWITLGTTSAKLARDVVLLLAQDGLGAHVGIQRKGPRWIGKMFTNTNLLLHRVTWNPAGRTVSTRVMNGHVVKTTHGRYRPDERGVWYPVKKLTRTPHKGLVYNTTTPSHTYVANGYLVHNCDCEINDDLVKENFKLPDDPMMPAKIGMEDGRLAEEYYAKIMKDSEGKTGGRCSRCGEYHSAPPQQPKPQQGQGQQPQQGKGQKPQSGAGKQPGQGQPQPGQGQSCGDGSQSAPGSESGDASGNGDSSEAGDGSGQGQGSSSGSGSPSQSGSGGSGSAGSASGPGPRITPPCQGQSQGQGTLGNGSCGSAATGLPAPYELPAPGGGENGNSPGLSEIEQELVRRQVAQSIKEHCKSRGNVPAGWARWADAALQPPKQDWRKVLAGAIRNALVHMAGSADYSHSRVSRRHRVADGWPIMPGMTQPLPQIDLVIDTSGSMSDELLTQAMVETRGVLRANGHRTGVRVHACDAAIHTSKRVFTVGQIQLAGGGGTDMGVGIAHAMTQRPRPDVIVVFTDGFTPWPATAPPNCRVVVALLDNSVVTEGARGPYSPPAWARVVDVAP